MPAIPVRAQEDVIRAGRRMDARGWMPATAGNISVRVGGPASARVAITRSGVHKSALNGLDVIEVDLDGTPADPTARPSAETLLHCQIYRAFPQSAAVLHGHSVAGTVLSRHHTGDWLGLEGYELFKAFEGQTTHATCLHLRLFDNDQDIARLAARVAPHLASCPLGYYIRGHGAYVWAHDMDAALARMEALEFLLECEFASRRLGPAPQEQTP